MHITKTDTAVIFAFFVGLLAFISPVEACIQCRCRPHNADGSPGPWGAWFATFNSDSCAQSCINTGICLPIPCFPWTLLESQVGGHLPASACGRGGGSDRDRCHPTRTANAC
jgi:hypothetical protein